MCGICGIAFPEGQTVPCSVVESMNNNIFHRGPDGEGFFFDGNIGLGHRRLSIIDLEGGSQPIFNEDGSVVVVFNGEIYNYRELFKDLSNLGHRFKTHSDTETLVHLYEEYGIGMLEKLRGMFAFAIFDRNKKRLYVVRDRFGIKPVYYYQHNGKFYFSSEIKPLIKAGYSVEVNRNALHLYFRTRFAHSDETIFKRIFRLAEGSYICWHKGNTTFHRYYPTPDHNSVAQDLDYEALFEGLFSDAVSSHMIADVPVGAYLSGGVDSSTIVSEMVRLTGHPVRTFCVDFKEGYSEAKIAEDTAKSLCCEHHTILCGINELLELPKVIRTLEEPVGDGIVVAQYFLSQATQKSGIKTVLTGDGADETLGGYQFLSAIINAARLGRWLPEFIVSSIGVAVANRLPLGLIDFLAGLPFDVASEARSRLVSMLKIISKGDLRELYDLLISLYLPKECKELYTIKFYSEISSFPAEYFAGEPIGRTLTDKVLSMQYRKWLPANINLKQDKLCMAHSVENRVPFLDHKFVEKITTFPRKFKIHGRHNKILLRNLAKKRLGNSIAFNKKVPFHLPLELYLRNKKLWDMVEDNLNENRVARRGIIHPTYVKYIKELARSGNYLIAKKMFALVIIELWHRIFVDGESI
jgi:asparagine synthase (glutamine-hydrolysing)